VLKQKKKPQLFCIGLINSNPTQNVKEVKNGTDIKEQNIEEKCGQQIEGKNKM